MKYIFLDIDGVLNSNDVTSCDKSPEGFLGLNYNLVKILSEFVKEEKPKVILSSTWRKSKFGDLEWLESRLKEYDIQIDGYTTKDFSEDRRDLQIIDYIEKNLKEEDNFCIIDDSFNEVFTAANLNTHYVRTEHRYGILKSDIDEIKEILSIKPDYSKFKKLDKLETREATRFGK